MATRVTDIEAYLNASLALLSKLEGEEHEVSRLMLRMIILHFTDQIRDIDGARSDDRLSLS